MTSPRHLGQDVCGTAEQPRYKVSSHLSVESCGFRPTPVSHPYCLIQLTSGCMTQMSGVWAALLVGNCGVLLCFFHIVIEVYLYCSGCNWQFWSHDFKSNASPLVLPQSPLTGCYMSLIKISNPQPLHALFYSGTQLLFSRFPTG